MESSSELVDSSILSEKEDDHGDEIELTPIEALEQLEVTWRNELLAPELLTNRTDLVDSVLEQIREVEEDVRKAEKGSLESIMKKMEVDRIRYVVTSYLRCRLQKIENFVFHAVSDDEKRKRDGREVKMSTDEVRFALEYRTQLEEYLQAVALQKMPSNAQKLDREKIASRPNLDHYVFVRTTRRAPNVTIPNMATTDDQSGEFEADLEANTQHVMPYKVASKLIRDGTAYLL